ncbi:MAG: sensor histidine kinase [Pseudomonadota bacterium]
MASLAIWGHNSGMANTLGKPVAEMAAALFTWAIVMGVVFYVMFTSRDGFAGTLEPTIALALLNLFAMLAAGGTRSSLLKRRCWHGVQLVSALALGVLLPVEFLQIFTIIWIAMALSFYSLRSCLVLLVIIMTTWYLILDYHWPTRNVVLPISLFASFHVFAILTSRAAIMAERARDQTQELYRELVATQHLLSEASRQNERTRIARDLHDLLGHHLTALTINLQIAEHQSHGEARERIEQSRSLARLLLSDVREAVSALRDKGELDFRRALALLVENVPQLSISLDISADLSIDDVEIADAIVRCVQEGITNTLRHADATQIWIKLWQEEGAVQFTIHDDGFTADVPAEGNGLKGMRERLQRVGGRLQLDRIANALMLRAEIPLAMH